MTIRLLMVSLCFISMGALLEGCLSPRANEKQVELYLAPFREQFSNVLVTKSLINQIDDKENVPLSSLYPVTFCVVMLNTGSHSLMLPSFNRDSLGRMSLHFDLKVNQKIFSVARNICSNKDSVVNSYFSKKVYIDITKDIITLEPNEAFVMIPNFGDKTWSNSDQWFAHKSDENVMLKASYEIYSFSEGKIKTNIIDSPWVSVEKLFRP